MAAKQNTVREGWGGIIPKANEKEFSIVMSKEHLSNSIQQHLRQFSYLRGDDDYFEVNTIVFDNTDTVLVKGTVERGTS